MVVEVEQPGGAEHGKEGGKLKVLIVFDGKSWFVRRVRVIEHDLDRDEKVYRCDKPLGGPFKKLLQAAFIAFDAVLPKKRRHGKL